MKKLYAEIFKERSDYKNPSAVSKKAALDVPRLTFFAQQRRAAQK